ncbi:MAG: molybdopterin-binding protein [Pirellulales bacterium]|nr:molybdopterin-binding protein [Pirellulales bacterium]
MNSPPPGKLTAEVVSIGDEMTSGARLDTNAQWISRRLGELGVVVTHHSTVADTLEDNVAVFQIASERVDVVVCTGGLGPTRDDLTRQALADLTGQPLELRPAALAHIESLFAQRQRAMPERNRFQAMFPAGSDEIFNPQGTAPGIDLAIARAGKRPCRIYALPGVPAEMKRMFDDTVAGRILEQNGGATHLRHLVMKFFGVGESDMESRLGEMISRDRQPRVGITVSAATISLRITATGESEQACQDMIAQTRAEILDRVGELYFGEGEHFEQQHALEQSLLQRGQSMMLIELGRAAPLGGWFAALGNSPAFRGGLSLADAGDLTRMSGCPEKADALEWFRRQFDADWLLLVDGYPCLEAAADHPQPAAEVSLLVICPAGKRYPTRTTLGGHPDILQPRIAKTAMAWMRKVMTRGV